MDSDFSLQQMKHKEKTEEVGKDGVVSMESAGDEITSYEIVDGATVDKGLKGK